MYKRNLQIISATFIMTVCMLIFVSSTRSGTANQSGDLSQILYPLAFINLLLGFCVAKYWRGDLAADASGIDLGKFLSRHIISLALIESCAIIGFVLTFTSGDQSAVRALGAATILTMLAIWPRTQQ